MEQPGVITKNDAAANAPGIAWLEDGPATEGINTLREKESVQKPRDGSQKCEAKAGCESYLGPVRMISAIEKRFMALSGLVASMRT